MYIKMKTTLIIPAYNEDPKILKQIVKKSKKYVDKIIIIDDGSSKNIKIIGNINAEDINIAADKISLLADPLY